MDSKVNIVFFSIKIELSKIMKYSNSMFSTYNVPKSEAEFRVSVEEM